MKKTALILIAIFTASFAAQAQTLPAKADNYLKKNYPGWEISKFTKVEYQENKSVAKGDFNGDGKTDYAVVITKDDRIYTLALLATKTGFQAFNLLAQNEENAWIAGIGVNAKGTEINLNEAQADSPKPFRLKNDGVYLYDGEGHGQTFYWQNGKFLLSYDL
jgi:hypothetical protein